MTHILEDHHLCCLKNVDDDIVNQRTPRGPFFNFRKWLRRFTMSSESNKLTKLYLKSQYALREDKHNHYNYHFWSISPLSLASKFLDIFYVTIFISYFLMFPIIVAGNKNYLLRIIKNMIEIMFLFHLMVSIFVGFIDDNVREIVLDKRRILRRYFLYHFPFEVVSSLPLELGFYGYGGIPNWFLFFVPLKIFRITYFISTIKNIKLQYNISSKAIVVFYIILLYLWFCCWFTGIILITKLMDLEEEKDSVITKLIKTSFVTISLLLTTNNNGVFETNVLFQILGILLNFIFKIVIFGFALYLFMTTNSSKLKYQQLLKQLKKFIATNDVPSGIVNKMKRYFDFRFDEKYFDEKEIFKDLPYNLRKELAIELHKKYIDQVKIFKLLPLEVKESLCSCLKLEIYLPNDVVMENVNEDMFFVDSGSVAVYTPEGKELDHLEDNSYFGELNLIMQAEMPVATIVAISCCKLYVLKRIYFQKIMSKYPTELKYLNVLVRRSLQQNLNFMEKENVSVLVPQDILDRFYDKRKK